MTRAASSTGSPCSRNEYHERRIWPGVDRSSDRAPRSGTPIATAASRARASRQGAVDGRGTPVVSDQHGAIIATERLEQRHGIPCQCRAVTAVCCQPRRRVAAHERRDGAVTAVGEGRHEVAPGVGGVGESVQEEHERPLAELQCGELDAVSLDSYLAH